MSDSFTTQSFGSPRDYAEQLLNLLSKTTDKTALVTLHRTLSTAENSVFEDCLIARPERWAFVFTAVEKLPKDEEVIKAADFIVRKGASILASKAEQNGSLKHFCAAVNSNFIINTVLTQFMWPHCDAQLEIQVISTVGSFLECLLLLDQYEPQLTSAMLCDTCLALRTGGFFTLLTAVLETGPQHDNKVEHMAHRTALKLVEADQEMYGRGIDKLPSHLMRKMLDLLSKQFKVNEWDNENSFPSVDEGGKQISELSLLNAIDLITFATDSNLSFRKKFLERLLFEDDAFPIVKALSWLSDQLTHCFSSSFRAEEPTVFILQCFLNKDILIFSLVDKLMELWIESNAQSFDDLRSVLETFKVAFFQRDSFLGAKEPDVGACLVNIRSLTYEDLRKLQLKQIRASHYKKWEKQISQFDSMLSNQVLEYVRHQRLLQLQKGAWVYSENPLDNNVKQPKVYFLVLCDNQMNLLAREFRIRSEENPSVQGNEIISSSDTPASKSKTIVIPLRRINKFQHWRVQSENKVPENAKLINILNKAVYTEIHLLDKDAAKLLRFFLDTKEASYIWLDGLQLIVASALGKKPALSDDIKSQISTLVDLRKNVQIIGLDDQTKLEHSDQDSEAEEMYYDLETLQSVATDFHYD